MNDGIFIYKTSLTMSQVPGSPADPTSSFVLTSLPTTDDDDDDDWGEIMPLTAAELEMIRKSQIESGLIPNE